MAKKIATAATTITTLRPSVRLVVFKFLIKSDLVPAVIPRLPVNRSGVMPAVRGEEVLPPTPDVYLANLVEDLIFPGPGWNYVFVGARVADERGDGKSDVRFTFCHRRHLNNIPSHPDFEQRFCQLSEAFRRMVIDNLWSVQGYLNPYLLEDGTVSKDKVLMFNCAGRRPAINPDGSPVEIYQGGREKPSAPGQIGQGIGPKVPLLDISNEIKMSGNKVLFVPRSR